jgi:hypothetical protein
MTGGVPIDFLVKKFTFDVILNFGCHFEFIFFVKVWFFSENKTLQSLKKYCTVDLQQFFKKSLLKSVILVHSAILDYFKKRTSMICLFLKAEQNVKEIFEKSQFLKI